MWEDDKLKEFYPLKNFALPNFSVPDLMFYLICSFVFILLVSYFRKFIFRIDNRKPYQMAPERLNKFDFYWLHTFGNIFMLDIHKLDSINNKLDSINSIFIGDMTFGNIFMLDIHKLDSINNKLDSINSIFIGDMTFGNIFMLDIHIFLRIEVMGNENVEILKKALNFVPQKKLCYFHLLIFPKKLFSVFGKMNHDNFIKSHFTFFVHFIQR